MKLKWSFFILCILCLLRSLAIHAEDELEPGEEEFIDSPSSDYGNEDSDIPSGVKLGSLSSQGPGCNPENARAILGPDGKSLSLLFDNMVTRSGGSFKKRTFVDCALNIPVSVPLNFQVMITRLDYRGFALAPQAGKAILKTHYQVIANNGKVKQLIKRRKLFSGPVNSDFIATARLRLNRFDLNCGESFTLGIKTRVIAVSNPRNEEAMMTLDSLDQTVNVKYALRWKRCR